jgi:hypothetical protein
VNLRCPNCDQHLSRLGFLRYWFFVSAPCTGCNSALQMDGRARYALIATVVVFVGLGEVVYKLSGSRPLEGVVVVLGPLIGYILSATVGSLVVPDKGSGSEA